MEDIRSRTFSCNWHDEMKRKKNDLLMISIASHRPLEIRLFKILKINLKMFIKLLDARLLDNTICFTKILTKIHSIIIKFFEEMKMIHRF